MTRLLKWLYRIHGGDMASLLFTVQAVMFFGFLLLLAGSLVYSYIRW